MSKVSAGSQARVFAGIDVSAKTLAVALQREGKDGFEQREFQAWACAVEMRGPPAGWRPPEVLAFESLR
jgi:hypothetical protein